MLMPIFGQFIFSCNDVLQVFFEPDDKTNTFALPNVELGKVVLKAVGDNDTPFQ